MILSLKLEYIELNITLLIHSFFTMKMQSFSSKEKEEKKKHSLALTG